MPFNGRVLLVGPLAGSRWRSISHYTATLAEALRAAGVEVDTVAAPWFNPPSVARGLRARWWRQPLVQAALRGEFAVVHLTDQALAHHVRRFRPHAPVVVTCHDLMAFEVPGYFHGRFEGALKRAFLRRPFASLKQADAVIAVSKYTAGAIERRRAAPRERVHTIPNIVRPVFRPMPRDEAEAAVAAAGIVLPRSPRLLSVGHAGGYKNLEALITALSLEGARDANLIRVGGLQRHHYRLARELGVRDRIVLRPGIDDGALAALMNACDILVQPSLAEGFGLPVAEAMACGLRVITSDGGALPEVAGDGGAVFARDGTAGLRAAEHDAQAIASLIPVARDDAELAARAVARAAAFASASVVPQFIELYDQICRERMARTGSAR